MVLFPLSLEAIIKRQRFIKAKTLSFSQTLLLGWGRPGSRAAGHLLLPSFGGEGLEWAQDLRTEALCGIDGFLVPLGHVTPLLKSS